MRVDTKALDFAMNVFEQLSVHPEHEHPGEWMGLRIAIAGDRVVVVYSWKFGVCRWTSALPPFSRPGRG